MTGSSTGDEWASSRDSAFGLRTLLHVCVNSKKSVFQSLGVLSVFVRLVGEQFLVDMLACILRGCGAYSTKWTRGGHEAQEDLETA